MADLSKRFQEIMTEIQNNINDEKELEFINKKITELTMLQMDVIDDLTDVLKSKINSIEKSQKDIENKINSMQSCINGIESDMYDEGFEFEIICPYCNNEFVADIESKSEIRCPECNNVIELDWNTGDEHGECSGHCSNCSSGCGSSFFEEFGEDVNICDDDDNDDDM